MRRDVMDVAGPGIQYLKNTLKFGGLECSLYSQKTHGVHLLIPRYCIDRTGILLEVGPVRYQVDLNDLSDYQIK